MKLELGITGSIGVSFNKISAKLGSDYKKPVDITTIYEEEFKRKTWTLPILDILYVGSNEYCCSLLPFHNRASENQIR